MQLQSWRTQFSICKSLDVIRRQVLLFALCSFCFSNAHSTEVAFAGFAYSGDNQSIAARFPYSKRFEESIKPIGINGLLQKTVSSVQPPGYSLIPRIAELKGRDQAVSVALVMTNETVSTEQLGPVYKLLVQLRGQALFFDFKSKTILRAYPFSFAYIDALSAPPTDAQKDASIKFVYLGTGGKPGIIQRFSQALAEASIPADVPRYVQVTDVSIGEEARSAFPPEFANGAAEAWVADTFGEAIASKMGIPILPYAKGYAIGKVLSMTISDGAVYNLKLPSPDYQFSVNITKLKKIVYEEKASGKGLIYGAAANFKLEEPLSGVTYLDGLFKNGEIKIVPASQVDTDDFPAFQDSMRGLFTKLSGAISTDDSSWLKSAATATNIEKQIAYTREKLKSCK